MTTTMSKTFSLDAEALETIEDNCCFISHYWASEIWFNINQDAPEESTVKVVEEHEEMEGSNIYYFPSEKLEQAFEPCINSVNSDIARDLQKFIDTNDAGYLDGEACDCLLQFACFGELVYS